MSKGTFQPEEDSSSPPIAVAEAQQRILDTTPRVGIEILGLSNARGRVLRETVYAPRDVPEGDNSAMDGYAVRAEDLKGASRESPRTLEVAFDVPAGVVPDLVLRQGFAARIMTGALIPSGADAVVPVEATDAGRSHVAIFRVARAGDHIRRAGEDMAAGTPIVEEGTKLGSGEIVVLATAQKSPVMVSRRPRVAIVPTGDELIEIEEPFRAGGTVNSNAWSIAALAEEHGCVPDVHEIVRDDLDATVDALRRAATADVVITTGGVSAGAFDFVKRALDVLGGERLFWRVNMKPGKPLLYGKVLDRPFFGLPGNPVSSMVSFHLFVGPALHRMLGTSGSPFPVELDVTLEESLPQPGERETFHRVDVVARDGDLRARPISKQGSGMSSSMSGANGLARLRAGERAKEAGDKVSTILIGDLRQE